MISWLLEYSANSKEYDIHKSSIFMLLKDKWIIANISDSLSQIISTVVIYFQNIMFLCLFVELGVFAKRYIPKSTQFGPFIGEPVASQNMLEDSKFILMVSWN